MSKCWWIMLPDHASNTLNRTDEATRLEALLEAEVPCEWPAGAHYYTAEGFYYPLECSGKVTHRIYVACANRSANVCEVIVNTYRIVVSMRGVCESCKVPLEDCWRIVPV